MRKLLRHRALYFTLIHCCSACRQAEGPDASPCGELAVGPQAAGMTAARRRCVLSSAFAPAIRAKASPSLAGKRPETCPCIQKTRPRAGKRLKPCPRTRKTPFRAGKRLGTCPRTYKPWVRAGEWTFAGTDHRFGVLRAAKCPFPGTAADRLSWPAATARRCGGLCAMALLAAAVASRCSGPGHSGPKVCSAVAPFSCPRATQKRLLSAFQMSTRRPYEEILFCYRANRQPPATKKNPGFVFLRIVGIVMCITGFDRRNG